MKLGSLVQQQFTDSFKTLMSMSGIPPKTAFAIRGIAKKIADEVAKYEELRKQYITEAAVKDANGKLIHEGTGIKMDPEKIAPMEQKFKELGDLDVKLSEVIYSDLGEAASRLTPENLFRLEFIVDG